MSDSTIYTRKQRKILLVFSIVFLLVVIVYGLKNYLGALLGSVILYILFLPMYRALVEKRKWNAPTTSVFIIILSFLVLVLPFLSLSLLLTDKILYYTSHFEEIINLIHRFEKFTGFRLNDKGTLQTVATKLGEFVSRLFPSILGGALELFIFLGLMYFVMYYLQVYNRTVKSKVFKFLPFDKNTINALTVELKSSVNANVLGLGIISMVQASLVGLGFWMFGLPDPLFWGLISFFAAFIPILGTPLIWGPGGIYLIMNGHTGNGIGLLVYGAILVLNIDNVLRLYIAKKMGDIHPLITIVGVILGVPMFGILGLVVGPLMISYLLVLVKVYENEYRKGLVNTATTPTDSS